ncbi:cell division protein PerM [Actinokineospora iranica]|uniref:Uncharacterized protein n=1 Tax=Actinokineospora iranica TaxID=1271860 RepID=A0A1G6SJ56_9PSEU|nr:DUF6350 family protein [Actinokineospora iranica]SDD16714.1 hypothetical protein SAMN05216174_1086 [Actinokineospora iranica]
MRAARTEVDRTFPRSLWAKVLAVVAIGPLLAVYAAVAALLALVTAVAAEAHFSTAGVLAAAMPGWLAAYQVPVGIGGRSLGALPMLPTVLVLLLVWRTAGSAADRLDVVGPREAGRVVAAVVGAHAVVGLGLALLCSGGAIDVDPLAGLYYPALLAGLAASVGVLPRSGAAEWVALRVDRLALRGLWAGLLAVVALLAVGAGVLTLALAASFGTIRDLFDVDDTGSAVGMLLLSAGYLPNAIIAATGFAAGPGFGMGGLSIGPLGFTGGSVPALPLLGALPADHALWWLLLLALPAGVGALVGWVLRAVDDSPRSRLRAVAVASVVVALVFAVLGGSAGGPLGGGPFDPLDLRAAWLSVALAVWVGVPGGIVAWLTGPREHEAIEPDSFDSDGFDSDSSAADSVDLDDLDRDDPDFGDDPADVDPHDDPLADPQAAETPDEPEGEPGSGR